MTKKNGQYVGVDEKYIPEEEKYVDNSTNSEIKDTVNQGLNAANDYINDKDNQEKIKQTGKKSLKIAKGVGIGYLVFVGIILVVVIVLFIIVSTFIFGTFKQFDEAKNNTNELFYKAKENITSEISSQKASTFNDDFEMYYNGTQDGENVSKLLSEVVLTIKKNPDHSISVVYGNIVTSAPNEIINLKSKFNEETDYEVTFDYDKNGYINKVTILNKQ